MIGGTCTSRRYRRNSESEQCESHEPDSFLVASLVRERIRQNSNTVFHAVLDSTLPEHEKSVDRLSDEGFVMIVAGGENRQGFDRRDVPSALQS